MRTHGTKHVSRSIGQPQLSKFTTRYVSTWQWPKSSVRAAQRVGDSKQDRWNTDSKGTRSEKGEPGHKRQKSQEHPEKGLRGYQWCLPCPGHLLNPPRTARHYHLSLFK